jgi:Acetyltransferase (GNAT) family
VPIRVFDADAPDTVFAFLDETVSRRGRAHWWWKYRLGASAEPSGFYWQEPDGRVLGFIGMMRTHLHVASAAHPATWFVDWHVRPGERGVGVGLGLLRKAEAAAGTLLTLQGSADTRKLLPRLGWRQSLSPTTWVRPLRRGFVADWLARRAPAALRGVAGMVTGPLTSYFRALRPARIRNVSVSDVDAFPPEYDAPWRARAREFAPVMTRESTYLNYLCADYPDGGYRLQLVREHHDLIGHLITRVDDDRQGFQRGRIVDLLWPRRHLDLLLWLIQLASWQLYGAGADYIECVASAPDLADALQRERFGSRRAVPIWYHRLPPGVPEPDKWYISFLDCDRAYR